MAAITGHILVGHAHPNDGGLNTRHQLTLSEGDRPAWLLKTNRPSLSDPRRRQRIVWVPSVENTLDDAFLMIALYIVESEPVRAMFDAFRGKIDQERIEVYRDLSDDQRQQLYALCREITNFPKLVLCIFEGSHMAWSISVLENYSMECEVLMPVYTRTYSRWAKETLIHGSLEAKRIQ